jgi:predicted GNAT family acetyltransferase
MELRRYHQAQAFYEQAESFLLAHEAHHNLILGLCSALIDDPRRFDEPPYLATVEDGDVVVAAALRTPPNRLVLSEMETDEPLPVIAEDLGALYPALPGVLGPGGISLRFAELWQERSGQPFHKRSGQRIYQLESVNPVSGVPGRMRRATPADRELAVNWFQAFSDEVGDARGAEDIKRGVDQRFTRRNTGLYFWEREQPVAMAGYGGPTPNGIRIGPVYTPPEQRGHGYASACVAGLSQLLLDEGRRYVFLFTDLSNPTSNHIYQEIGYRPVCDVDEYIFSSPDAGQV